MTIFYAMDGGPIIIGETSMEHLAVEINLLLTTRRVESREGEKRSSLESSSRGRTPYQRQGVEIVGALSGTCSAPKRESLTGTHCLPWTFPSFLATALVPRMVLPTTAERSQSPLGTCIAMGIGESKVQSEQPRRQ